MSDYHIIYEVQIIALAVALVMIVMAHEGFNGFAFGFVALGVFLILRRVDDTTGLIG